MRAIQFRMDRRAAVVSTQAPVAGPVDAIIKVGAAGICGSDVTALTGQHPFRVPPLISGHEAGGTIVEIGDHVVGLRVGDRVAVEPQIACTHCVMCDEGYYYLCLNKVMLGVAEWPGSFAEYIRVPFTALHVITSAVDDELSALVEPMAVAVHAVRQADAIAGGRIAILGGGTIGAFIAFQCLAQSASEVIVTDPRDRCRSIIGRIGAEGVHPDAIERNIGGSAKSFFDTVFVATAFPGALDAAVGIVKPRSDVVQVGLFGEPELVTIPALQMAERRIVGSNVYDSSDFTVAAASIAANPEAARAVITHRGSLEDAAQHLNARLDGGMDDAVKYVVFPNEARLET